MFDAEACEEDTGQLESPSMPCYVSLANLRTTCSQVWTKIGLREDWQVGNKEICNCTSHYSLANIKLAKSARKTRYHVCIAKVIMLVLSKFRNASQMIANRTPKSGCCRLTGAHGDMQHIVNNSSSSHNRRRSIDGAIMQHFTDFWCWL